MNIIKAPLLGNYKEHYVPFKSINRVNYLNNNTMLKNRY